MSKDNINDIIGSFSSSAEHRFVEGATEEQISAFEKENGIELPQGVRNWLAFSDGGEMFLPAGVQFYGVVHGPLIDMDEDGNYLCIGALPNGDPVVCEKTGERISVYDKGAGQIKQDEVYENFNSFLEDLPKILGY